MDLRDYCILESQRLETFKSWPFKADDPCCVSKVDPCIFVEVRKEVNISIFRWLKPDSTGAGTNMKLIRLLALCVESRLTVGTLTTTRGRNIRNMRPDVHL